MGRLIYLLDTNTISEPVKNIPNQNVIEKIECYYSVCSLSIFTVYELIKGINQLSESKKRSRVFTYAEKTISELEILDYTIDSAYWHGKEEARLQSIGKSPSYIDAQIAAVAKVNNLVLVTRNTDDFKHFSDIKLENWFN